jgi:glutamine amidotransferase-like uncharacterized protein
VQSRGKPGLSRSHAVRRWCSADRSQLHEQAKAGGVGESLEPGGGGAVLAARESEVAIVRRYNSEKHERRANLAFEHGKGCVCSGIHLKAVSRNTQIAETGKQKAKGKLCRNESR